MREPCRGAPACGPCAVRSARATGWRPQNETDPQGRVCSPDVSAFSNYFLLLRLLPADVVVVHPHVLRLSDRVANPAPNRPPRQLVPPEVAVRTGAELDVVVLANLHAVDPPVRFPVCQVSGVGD